MFGYDELLLFFSYCLLQKPSWEKAATIIKQRFALRVFCVFIKFLESLSKGG